MADALASHRAVLLEGAQGALLDVDHGTYPFVTSSSTTAGGHGTGAGIGPTAIDAVLGIVKAYTTRVGNGPLPTEAPGEMGERLRELGGEFGAVTGRPRRCGWFDAMVVRYSVRVNGLTHLAVTKLDVLDTIAELPVCTGYTLRGAPLDALPDNVADLQEVVPVYDVLPRLASSPGGAPDRRARPGRPAGQRAALPGAAGARGGAARPLRGRRNETEQLIQC